MTATGYSNLYQYMVLFGGVCYWTAGTAVLYKLLTKYLGFSKKVSLLTCIVITYGTNLFHYASYDACFSHVYSYFLFNVFLYYLCWYEERDEEGRTRLWQTCIFGLLAGLIFMCRNTNLLAYGNRALVFIFLWRGVFLLAGASAWEIPVQCEKRIVFWSPVLLLALIGMAVAFKVKGKLYTGLMTFFILIVYVSSAWWAWFYGGSFGQRVVVDYMCLFAVLIAYLFDRLEKWHTQGDRQGGYKAAYGAVLVFCSICIVWNLICMAAYWYRVLPSDGANWSTIRDIVGMVL